MSILPVICYQYLQIQLENRRKVEDEKIRNNTVKVDNNIEPRCLYQVSIRELKNAYVEQILKENNGGTRL